MKNLGILFSIFLISTILFFGNSPEILAKILFPSIDFRLDGPPTFCALKPVDEKLTIQKVNTVLSRAEEATFEWKYELQRVESENQLIWEMHYNEISEQQSQSDCDVVIKFIYQNSYDAILGEFIPDSDPPEIILNIFRDDTFESISQVEPDYYGILLHEIGHSLGLGHYVSTQQYRMVGWIIDNEAPPSIMTPIQNVNYKVTRIMDKDIEKIRSIYGGHGFYAFSGNIPAEIKELPDVLPPIELPIDHFDWVSVPEEAIVIKDYETTLVKITGQLFKDQLKQGVLVNLILHYPDQTTELIGFTPTRSGLFEVTLNFDSESPKGTYIIESMYKNIIQDDMKTKMLVVDEKEASLLKGAPENQVEKISLPPWIKSNAKWWSEGSIKDSDFVQGIQYMINNEIIILPNLPETVSSVTEGSKEIPSWIKNNAEWWSQGLISDNDFVKGIQYLVEQGIIRV